MKTLKRSVAILLASLFVLSLTACAFGGSSIVGTWKYQISLKDIMAQMAETAEDDEAAMYDVMSSAMDGIGFDLYFEFADDGNCKYYIDEGSAKLAVEQMKENLIAVLPELFEAMGVSREDFDSYLETYGITKDELAASLAESLDADSFAELSETGTYKTESGKLYLDDDTDSYIVYELKDGKLIFTKFVGDIDSDLPEWLFPMTFDKAD